MLSLWRSFAPWLLAASLGQGEDLGRDTLTLLRSRCGVCHGEKQQMGALRLDRPEAVRAKAQRLVAVLTRGVNGRFMPPVGPRFTLCKVSLVRRWVDAGLPWAEVTTQAGQPHWAFRRITRPPAPAVRDAAWVRNPIDAFILARLEKEGLAPASAAPDTTLIRRLSLDLTGLPPAPGERLEELPARLLDSPHFGEKWARHWLDLARYGDSDGYKQDSIRPHAWRYRDWVIEAHNRNMPFDQFPIAQVAGDLLPGATVAQQTATGFHRNKLTSREGGSTSSSCAPNRSPTGRKRWPRRGSA